MVHVITTIERGGAENAVLSLARVQVENGYQVVVVPLKGDFELKDAFEASGVTVDTDFLPKSFLNQVFHMRKKFLDVDLFHAHLPRAELLMRLSKAKSGFLVTRHNTEAFFPKYLNSWSKLLSRFVLQRSLGVIFISTAVKQFLLTSKEMSHKTFNAVIYYGYSPRNMNSEKEPLVHKGTNRRIELGTISRLAPQKNLELLIEFANLLREKGLSSRIRVVGEGPNRSILENKVFSLNLMSEIQFLGRMTDVFPFLNSLDFFVLTSNYEGLGLVLLEAMDARLPIIAPRNSAIPEVLGDHHPGLFETGDLNAFLSTFMTMLTNDSTRQKALNIQSQRLNRFSMESYFEHHHDFYNQVLDFTR